MDRLMNTQGKLDLVGITAVSVVALAFFAAELSQAAGWIGEAGLRSTPVATTALNCTRPS